MHRHAVDAPAHCTRMADFRWNAISDVTCKPECICAECVSQCFLARSFLTCSSVIIRQALLLSLELLTRVPCNTCTYARVNNMRRRL